MQHVQQQLYITSLVQDVMEMIHLTHLQVDLLLVTHGHIHVQQVVLADVEQHEQHIIMLVRQISIGHTGRPLVLQ